MPIPVLVPTAGASLRRVVDRVCATILLIACSSLLSSVATAATPAPLAHWPLDQVVAGAVFDASPHGLHGALRGPATSVVGAPLPDAVDPAGDPESALELDGDAVIVVEDSGTGWPLDLGSGWTLAAWVRPTALGGVQALISKDGVYELEMGHAGSDRYSVRLGNRRRGAGLTALRAGVWQHVAAVWDGAAVRYYLDGVADGVALAPVPPPSNDRAVGLGGRPSTFAGGSDQHRLRGALDDVRIYDMPLDAAQMASLAGAPPPDPDGSDDDDTGQLPGDGSGGGDGTGDGSGDDRPPILSASRPRGTLPAGTDSVALTLDTDRDATCRWSRTPGRSYAEQEGRFESTGGRSHQATVVGLVPGTVRLYARCLSGDLETPDDHEIAFFIDPPHQGFHPRDLPGTRFFVESRTGVTVAFCDTETCRTAGDNAPLEAQYCDLTAFPDGCVRRWRDDSDYLPSIDFEPPEWTTGRDFGQDDPDKPGFILDCLGSMPCVRGGAGVLEDRTLEIEPGQQVDGLDGPFSLVVLARPIEQPDDVSLFGFAGSLMLRKPDGRHLLRIAFGDTVTVAPAGSVAMGAWHLYELHRDAQDRVRLVVDGVEVTERGSDGELPTLAGQFRFRFLLSVARVNAFHGDVALALVADGGLDPSTIDAVRTYVAEAYGVP